MKTITTTLTLALVLLAASACTLSGSVLGPSLDELPEAFATLELFFDT